MKMKKTVLSATIISALTATSFTALADGPNFYGRADLAITNSDMGLATQNQKSGTIIENNFSWLGVKGTEKINDELEVVYQMEFGVSNFDNSGDTFGARNTFLGLKSASAGTILVGRNDTVFKAAEGGFDLFGNTNSDIDLLAAGQTRSADGFTYYSPKIADLVTLNATYLMDDLKKVYAKTAQLSSLEINVEDSVYMIGEHIGGALSNISIDFLSMPGRRDGQLTFEKGIVLEGKEYSGDEIEKILKAALDTLPEKQRLVFNMKYYDEMKYNEMAEILETSVGALKASYHHAVKKIETILKEY